MTFLLEADSAAAQLVQEIRVGTLCKVLFVDYLKDNDCWFYAVITSFCNHLNHSDNSNCVVVLENGKLIIINLSLRFYFNEIKLITK